MPKRIQVRASAVSSAQPDEIYPLLVNSATYPLWSMIRYYESLRSGREGLHDVGALRLFKTNAVTVMREEVTDVVPNERVGYTLLSGFPLLDYRAHTTLEKTASDTRIIWESSFYPKYPLTAWYWRRLMVWVLRRLVKSLAETADDPERRSRILSLAQGKTSMGKRALRGV
jgi:uncharacterized protein YndB with AHSA1/START domain